MQSIFAHAEDLESLPIGAYIMACEPAKVFVYELKQEAILPVGSYLRMHGIAPNGIWAFAALPDEPNMLSLVCFGPNSYHCFEIPPEEMDYAEA